jgi:hypothetical protein
VNDCFHVIPTNDWREHDASPECWCKPTQDDDEPRLFVHHSMDRREEYEEGRLMS